VLQAVTQKGTAEFVSTCHGLRPRCSPQRSPLSTIPTAKG
jgi:hypothetical protein